MTSKEIWLIRHGETEWSRSGKHTGRTDVPLTEAGKRRAQELGHILIGKRFDLVLTSPLTRARETCRLAGFGDQSQVAGDLAEWDYGVFEGRTTAEIRVTQPDWSIWEADIVNGETLEQVAARARQVIAAASAVEGNVALFAHGHVLRIIAACWLDLPARTARLFALDTGSTSILGFEHTTRVMRSWNRAIR
jgi:broad specificity phosphatase PhoE